MTDQLVLIDSDRSWRMDSTTRERGIRGVNQAREALREARSRLIDAGGDPGRETGGDSTDDDSERETGGDSTEPGLLAPAA
jgi:hypothetical protein